jgi:hypothetical protein
MREVKNGLLPSARSRLNYLSLHVAITQLQKPYEQ